MTTAVPEETPKPSKPSKPATGRRRRHGLEKCEYTGHRLAPGADQPGMRPSEALGAQSPPEAPQSPAGAGGASSLPENPAGSPLGAEGPIEAEGSEEDQGGPVGCAPTLDGLAKLLIAMDRDIADLNAFKAQVTDVFREFGREFGRIKAAIVGIQEVLRAMRGKDPNGPRVVIPGR